MHVVSLTKEALSSPARRIMPTPQAGCRNDRESSLRAEDSTQSSPVKKRIRLYRHASGGGRSPASTPEH
ncbi:hypothetical protein DDI_2338 [Dickeya dianthicola RNS04.9]|nr:hypothetical protein DDI_2338 [Dickeya dianthicola RNS04.9]